MLRLSSSFYDQTILSLRTGGRIGVAKQPIINPNNPKIEGWYCEQAFEKGEFILPNGEIRDLISKGIVVNDHEALTHPEDMIRLREVIDIRFELIGKTVSTENKKKLGRVADFAVDDISNLIQKIYVTPTLLHGLTQDQLIIERSMIVEITDKKIVVQDTEVKADARAFARAQA